LSSCINPFTLSLLLLRYIKLSAHSLCVLQAVKEAVWSQAETDSEEFQRKLEELHEEHRAELADARAEALRHAQIVHKLEKVRSTFRPFVLSSPLSHFVCI
jgi:hypothetical protein